MKIAYHHRTLGDGAEGVHIAEIVRALGAEGHEVDLFSLVGKVTNAPNARARWIAAVRKHMPRTLFELAEIGYGVAGSLPLAARMRASGAEALYERYALANAAGAIATRALGTPFLLEVNAPLALEREQYEGGLRLGGILGRVERSVFRAADRCIVVSTPLAAHLRSLDVAPERIEVMPNGADPTRFDPRDRGDAVRARHGLGAKLVVGFVGVVRNWHGLDLLARAFAAAAPADAVLLVVGDGPACEELMTAGRELGIADRIKITGRVPHEAIPDHIAAMDVAVSPRATFYASPMKIPEYMAGGRAVVAPRTPNIEDLIEHGRTGLLFAPESIEALAGCIWQALSNPELRGRIARAGRREVEERINWRRNARRIVELAEIVKRERDPSRTLTQITQISQITQIHQRL